MMTLIGVLDYAVILYCLYVLLLLSYWQKPSNETKSYQAKVFEWSVYIL
jgi:hypothetical protein